MAFFFAVLVGAVGSSIFGAGSGIPLFVVALIIGMGIFQKKAAKEAAASAQQAGNTAPPQVSQGKAPPRLGSNRPQSAHDAREMAEAAVTIAAFMSLADGTFSSTEQSAVQNFALVQYSSALPPGRANDLIAQVQIGQAGHVDKHIMKFAARSTPDDRRALLGACCRVAVSDKKLPATETAFLRQLARGLNIPAAELSEIFKRVRASVPSGETATSTSKTRTPSEASLPTTLDPEPSSASSPSLAPVSSSPPGDSAASAFERLKQDYANRTGSQPSPLFNAAPPRIDAPITASQPPLQSAPPLSSPAPEQLQQTSQTGQRSSSSSQRSSRPVSKPSMPTVRLDSPGTKKATSQPQPTSTSRVTPGMDLPATASTTWESLLAKTSSPAEKPSSQGSSGFVSPVAATQGQVNPAPIASPVSTQPAPALSSGWGALLSKKPAEPQPAMTSPRATPPESSVAAIEAAATADPFAAVKQARAKLGSG